MPVVSFSNVSIFYGSHLILKDISFSIARGEFVYFIGKVGSGKTSLIKTMSAELPLKKGEAVVNGYPLHKLKKKQIPYLRRKMGIVFQDFQLLTDRNVHANLMFVLQATGWKHKPAVKRIEEVLQKVGLDEKKYAMPHQLSGGEQQRVVIARALLNHPDLILADEPTGNLDPETSTEIMDLLISVKEAGQTVVMITHNYNLLKKYPFRTIKMENGAIAETQTLQEIDFNLLMKEDTRLSGNDTRSMNDLFSAFYPEMQ
ncbi:MAG: ATP-binding cassette domain-containing protein [Bacteroidales bacterium]|jgi:cell division transport system ATP-binding protein|nr:ATP-binding cassette domain-containing protein [Bacteroidales bacterium]